MKLINGIKSFFIRYPYMLVSGFCFLLYFNSLFNGYNLDDELVTQNHQLVTRGIQAIPEIITSPYFGDEQGHKYEYRPVVLISYAIEYQLLGQNARVSHFINLLLYALLCVILLAVLNTLLGLEYAFYNLLVVLVFAAHPIHTEAVCSIKNRDELLALIFGLLATAQAIRYYDKSSVAGFLLSVLFLALGMFSKQSIINFSFIIPLALLLFRPVQLSKLVGYSFVVTFLMVIPLNINLLYQKAGLTLLNVGFFALMGGYKVLLSGLQKLLRIFTSFLRRSISQTGQIALWATDFMKRGWLGLKESTLKGKSQLVKYVQHHTTQPHSFLDPPVKLPTWFNLVIAMLLMACAGWLSVVFNNKAALAAGVLVALIYLLQMLQARGKIVVLYVLTLCIAAIAWYAQLGSMFRTFMLLTYVFLMYAYTWRTKQLWQVYGLIGVIGIFTVVISKGDIMQFIFPFFFMYLINRANKTYQRVLLWLFLVGLQLIAKELSPVTFINMAVTTGVFLYFVSGNNHRAAYFFGRVFLLLLPISVVTLLVTDKTLNKKAALVLIDPHSVLPKPPPPVATQVKVAPRHYFSLSQLSKPALEVKNFLATDISFTPAAARPLTFIEFPMDSATAWDIRIGTALSTMGHYLQKVIVPYPLGFYYGYAMIQPERMWNIRPVFVLMVYALILFSGFYFISRNRLISFACFIYLAGVVVYCNLFISIPGIVADRFLLIPSIGLSMALVLLLLNLRRGGIVLMSWSRWPAVNKVALMVLLSVYGFITVARNFQWADKLTLMRHDITYLDASAQAHNLLASMLNQKADQSADAGEQRNLRLEALQNYNRSIEISPTFFNVMFDAAHTCTLLNMPDSAIYFYKKAIPLHPQYIFSYLNIADLYFVRQQWPDVIFYLQEAIRTNPGIYDGYDKLSFAYFKTGDYGKAIAVNRAAIEKMPGNSLPYINTARIYIGMSRADSARFYLQKADTLSPGNELVHNLLSHL